MRISVYQAIFCVFCTIVCSHAVSYEKKSPGVSDETLAAALDDKRYLQRQIKCALGEGVCDPVGRKLKRYAPLLLRGSCPQCSPVEMRQVQMVLSHIQYHYPKEWSRMVKHYTSDPLIRQNVS